MRYHPPFDLIADLLFVAALARAGDLRGAYPGVPFVSILGRTPLIVWFSRVTRACYHDALGEVQCESGYTEVTVMAPLRRRRVFVPVIYASDERSVQIGQFWYHMPKLLAAVDVRIEGGRVRGRLGDESGDVSARLLGAVCRGVRRPRWTWPIHFPGGAWTRALIVATGEMRLARVESGSLPQGRLLAYGLYVGAVRMQLPRP